MKNRNCFTSILRGLNGGRDEKEHGAELQKGFSSKVETGGVVI